MKSAARKFPLEALWCANQRSTRGLGAVTGAGWAFPPKVESLLRRECEGMTVLHPFGGRARFGVRMDIDVNVRPDVIADAWLPPFGRDSFDVVILDPPYVRLKAQVKAALFDHYLWIARRRVIWFHTIWCSLQTGMLLEKAWLVRIGDLSHVRALQFFVPAGEKRQPRILQDRGPAVKYNRWILQPERLPFAAGGTEVRA